jgi:predicted RNA binding protein YcfA (HicA-like mRNA interferase family)
MRAFSGKELSRILERHGWNLMRIQGSHHIFGKPNTVVRLSVPIHGSAPLKKRLQIHLMKMAGLTDDDLDYRVVFTLSPLAATSSAAYQFSPPRLRALGGDRISPKRSDFVLRG